MHLQKISLSDTKAFSPFFLDYVQQKETLRPFYEVYPSPGNFNNLLTKKENTFPQANRKVLVEALNTQYQKIKLNPQVELNIQALGKADTFTVTTGHQLNIFTGPLYFIYKIVTVINTCKQLKAQYPKYNFVPVYWMASEDHDYDEIKYFRLNGKKYVWETKQSGAVGRFNTKDLKSLLNEVPGDKKPFDEAYTKFENLADAARYYVHELFKEHGLVVVDGDDRALKGLFKNVMHDDILDNSSIKIVEQTNQKLEALGYKTQIYCREINFFYLDNGIRSRIEKEGDKYRVVDTKLEFSEAEIKTLIDKEPEKLSPNVILRPLYQEMILPNIAYVGGPAEVVYWLQLKDVFQHHKIPFPALMPRNFAMVVDHVVQRKLEKTGIDLSLFFEPKNFLFNHWVLKNSSHQLTVGDERRILLTTFEKLREKAGQVDRTLIPYMGAEEKRLANTLEKIEKKLLRAEKRLHADKLRQIEEVKDALFPNDGLQERTDNFLNFFQRDSDFVSKLIGLLDPFDFAFNVVSYPEND